MKKKKVLGASRAVRGIRVDFSELKKIVDDLISPEAMRAGEICKVANEIERAWLKYPDYSLFDFLAPIINSLHNKQKTDSEFVEAIRRCYP
ncbi:MAG: hypothetical protein AAB626_02660 [Patescibacteria group bacterium]